MTRTIKDYIEFLQGFPNQDELIACPVLWDKAGAEQWFSDSVSWEDNKINIVFSPEEWKNIVHIFESGDDFSPDLMEEAIETVLAQRKDK